MGPAEGAAGRGVLPRVGASVAAVESEIGVVEEACEGLWAQKGFLNSASLCAVCPGAEYSAVPEHVRTSCFSVAQGGGDR